MSILTLRRGLVLTLLALTVLSPIALPQGGQGGSREAMWPAPTAEDWKKPCLITWQRTWEDALAVSRETGKPILICVNMDGEIASEHYAGIRYRQPETSKLYEPYVCVIASVYRHNPRDYDENGSRIPCPRFGGVTCGEHITIEPPLYEKYFDGQRVAPRHIMVELDGKETYDVYYAFDTDSVFKAIYGGIAERKETPKPVVKGDRSIVERVNSRDVADRQAVEEAYREGDKALQRSLLEAAAQAQDAEPNDLLRQAVFGFDADMGGLARKALAGTKSEAAIDLISEALRVPMDEEERKALVDALSKMGSLKARTLAVVHKGLAVRSKAVDVDGWARKLGEGEASSAVQSYEAAARLTRERELGASDDPKQRLELAEAYLVRARERLDEGRLSRRFVDAMFKESRDTALEAEKLGATGWRVNAAMAVASWYLGEAELARSRAEAAVSELPDDAQSWNSMIVLGLFAEARREAIKKAVKAKEEWPGQWLTDLHATYSVLARHPHGDASQVVAHYDFLRWMGAVAQAAQALDGGLERFPESWALHDRLRRRIFREKGIRGLEPTYEAMLAKEGAASDVIEWFAGYASLVTAEFHRRAGRARRANEAYDRAIKRYESRVQAEPDNRENADHYIALALAGRARVALERGELKRAVDEVIAAFERREASSATPDGLNITAVDTAKMLRSQLKEAKEVELTARLQAAMDALDPKLLELPAYERLGPRGGRRPPWRRRRRPEPTPDR